MNARDELADVTRGIDGPATLGGLEVADAILAAGYSKPRTISNVEELDALASGTALIGTARDVGVAGAPYLKLSNGEWWDYGNTYSVGSEDIRLPATLTYTPKES